MFTSFKRLGVNLMHVHHGHGTKHLLIRKQSDVNSKLKNRSMNLTGDPSNEEQWIKRQHARSQVQISTLPAHFVDEGCTIYRRRLFEAFDYYSLYVYISINRC
jgi:hypothetical protein